GLLDDLFDRVAVIRHDGKSTDPLTDSVARFLDERLDDPPGLDEISRHFGYHPDALNRRFKRRFGLSLRAYLIDRRLHRAKALLLEGKHSIAQVAAETGFYDQSHFIKAFKKAYSLPPKEYR
ncbi:MAG TPA: AraC family transcriptional regulator, partial [Nitratifractor salsuginis]|nr:AraC family transcriptional regulator [Nitratifractor salsuginis]